MVDPNLSTEERENIRAARAMAAEERLKKMGNTGKKTKKKPSSNEPLRGPNSQPLMRWNI